jgi:6-pyruvoyltetrahydropterin/6-carboxytetrahydropterin synthase
VNRWIVHSRTTFEASHALTAYRGEPEESHDHTWEVAIRVGTDALNDEGYAIDFHAVHGILEDAINPLHGTNLNQHPEIGKPSPSAERVAEVVAGWIAEPLERIGGRLISVSVWEGPDNRVDLVVNDA